MSTLKVALVGALMACSGCALAGSFGAPGGLLYTEATGRASFQRPEVRSDVHDLTVIGEATGEACTTNILGLVATGEGGYITAYDEALRKSGGTMLFDVKTDFRVMNILGLYGKSCTEISGIAVK